MDDEAKQLENLVEHLEAAARIVDGLGQPTTAYLIDQALREARAAMWPRCSGH